MVVIHLIYKIHFINYKNYKKVDFKNNITYNSFVSKKIHCRRKVGEENVRNCAHFKVAKRFA